MAFGANQKLKSTVTCHYCKDNVHVKDNCVYLNNKFALDIQIQEQATDAKQNKGRSTGPHVPKK